MPRKALRIIVIAALVAAFVVTAIWLWQRGGLTATEVSDYFDSLGAAGPPLFALAFIVGLQIGMPGIVFVVGARLAFGPYLGFALAYGSGLIGLMIPFGIGRGLRSKNVWAPKQKWIAKALSTIDKRPLTTVITLRLLLWFNAPLTYLLSATSLSWRNYIVGCVVALAPVTLASFVATGWFL
jgi:uncharacterized membrane protein YdjX (TVP38/TMEM64 family)